MPWKIQTSLGHRLASTEYYKGEKYLSPALPGVHLKVPSIDKEGVASRRLSQ